jgi:hypothetical protein
MHDPQKQDLFPRAGKKSEALVQGGGVPRKARKESAMAKRKNLRVVIRRNFSSQEDPGKSNSF